MKASITMMTAMILATSVMVACERATTAEPQPPFTGELRLSIISGDVQSGVVGQPLGTPLVVKVTQNGFPRPLQVLNFRVTTGNGSVFGGTELTNLQGIAKELWTLGTKAGEVQTVEVRAVDPGTGAPIVFATFTATAHAAAAGNMAATAGDGQSAQAGSAVPVAPAVMLSDDYGNPVSGVPVTFAVTGGGGSVTGATATTNASGVATAGGWTLGTATGINTLTATTPDATIAGNPVTFTANSLSGMPASCGGCWTVLSNSQPRYGATASAVGGILYLVGGSDNFASALPSLEAIDVNTGAPTLKAPMSTPRTGAISAGIDGILYVAGGSDASGTPLASVEAYDPATNSWTSRAPLPVPLTGISAAVIGGILYVAGGENVAGVSAALFAYDPAANSWTSRAPMPYAQSGAVAGAIDGILYVAGGLSAAPRALLAYDPASNSWSTRASMSTGRQFAVAGVVNGQFYVLGGADPLTLAATSAFEIYNPVTNRWGIGTTTMPVGRYSAASAVLNGALYVMGGLGDDNVVFSSFAVVRP